MSWEKPASPEDDAVKEHTEVKDTSTSDPIVVTVTNPSVNMNTSTLVKFYLPIILALIAGGFVPETYKFVADIITPNKEERSEDKSIRDKMLNSLETFGKIQKILNELKIEVGAKKVVLLKAHDSGSPIPDKVSIMSETYSPEYTIYDTWQSQNIDQPYIHMLTELLEKKGVTLLKEDLPTNSYLRTTFETFDIEMADVRLVGLASDRIYYISIHRNKDSNLKESHYEHIIRNKLTQIHNLLYVGGVIEDE